MAIFPSRTLGWWLRRLGLVTILTLTLLRFLPLIGHSYAIIMKLIYANLDCSLHIETLHFWTFLSASFIKFLLFSLIYWWTLIVCKDHQRWRSSLARSAIFYSDLTVSILGVTGWKLPSFRHLLLEVMKKVIPDFKEVLTISSDLAIASVGTVLTTSLYREKPHRSSSLRELWKIAGRQNDSGCQGRSASTSRKPLSRDIDNPMELYAYSASDCQVLKEPGIPCEALVHTRPRVCMMGVDNIDTSKTPCRSRRFLILCSCLLGRSLLTLYYSSHHSSKVYYSQQSSTIVAQLPHLAAAGLDP